jgi:hypothetical protein
MASEGHADAVIVLRDRREIADKQCHVRGIPAFSEEADHAAPGVAAVHPLKSGGIEIDFEQ